MGWLNAYSTKLIDGDWHFDKPFEVVAGIASLVASVPADISARIRQFSAIRARARVAVQSVRADLLTGTNYRSEN